MMATPFFHGPKNSKTLAPPKTNTGPLEKGIPFGKHHFQVPAVVFQGCISYPKLCFRNMFAAKLMIGIQTFKICKMAWVTVYPCRHAQLRYSALDPISSGNSLLVGREPILCGKVISYLDGGFKYFSCSPVLGEDSHFDIFSNGLKIPSSSRFCF